MFLWQTERWEIFISSNKEIFNNAFEINDEKANSLYKEKWEETQKAFKEEYERILLLYIP